MLGVELAANQGAKRDLVVFGFVFGFVLGVVLGVVLKGWRVVQTRHGSNLHNTINGYSHIIAPGTKFGANYLGRAGAQLGVSPISDVVDVLAEGGSVNFFYL